MGIVPHFSKFKEKGSFPLLAMVGAPRLGTACHTCHPATLCPVPCLTVPFIKGAGFGKQLNFCDCAILRTSVKPFDKGPCLIPFSASVITDFAAEAEREWWILHTSP